MSFTSEPGLTEAVFQTAQPVVIGTPALIGQPWPPPAINAISQAWDLFDHDVLVTASRAGRSLWAIANSWSGWK